MDPKSRTLDVQTALGTLPPLWDRRVIFVANLLGLFFGNDQETGVLRNQVGPLETYGGRLIPLLGLLYRGRSPNLAVLEQDPDVSLLDYFDTCLRLDLPEVAVLSHEDYQALPVQNAGDSPELTRFLERVKGHPAEWLDGFVTDACLAHLAQRLGRSTVSSQESSRSGNNKLLLHQHLVASGLPTFDTCIAESAADVSRCLASLRRQGYRSAAIKAQIGASGIGLARFPTDHAGDIPDYLFYEGACLVQGWMDDSCEGIESVRSPSVQLFLNDNTLHLYDLTDQILSEESVHEGNLAAPPWMDEDPEARGELVKQAQVAGTWLHRQGYRGTASVDFHVADRGGRREVRICEINARVTGATYPSVLARHFRPGGRWLMRNLKFGEPQTGQTLLETLEEAELLFHPGMSHAILPINFNTRPDQRVVKGQFLCLGDTVEELWSLLDEARHLLPVKGEFDRD